MFVSGIVLCGASSAFALCGFWYAFPSSVCSKEIGFYKISILLQQIVVSQLKKDNMEDIEREDIYILAKHSNWSEKSIAHSLQHHVYADKASWQKFLRLFCMSLGFGFLISGIIFFFAYNWADLHKFIKIGLVEGLLLVSMGVVLFSKLSLAIKNLVLTAAAMLVGVVFAVFGQIYQTGANAYDFFLGWTLFIAIWVFISNYAPLWLIFITLVNTTVWLYWAQVAPGWTEVTMLNLLFVINTLFVATSFYVNRFPNGFKVPIWLSNVVALAAVFYSTIGLIIGIFDRYRASFFVLLILTSLVYGMGMKLAFKVKSAFYFSIVLFSVITVVAAFFIQLLTNAFGLLFVSIFVIGSVTLVIKKLIDLQKQWIK